MTIQVREYGPAGHTVVVLHGGPGAAGGMAPLARQLATSFRVLEPFQRPSGAEPLTVSRHVVDLHEVLETLPAGPPALVGHSWGAMLALAYAAAHPGTVGPLVLIGCGTFDTASRRRLQATREERMDDGFRHRLEELGSGTSDPNARFEAVGRLFSELDAYDSIDADAAEWACDAKAYEETWNDLLVLLRQGVYPTAFAAITTPVVMLHGAYDPHPGRMIRDNLGQHMPQLEYREWERCGHEPWLEKAVRDDFLSVLRAWLSRHLSAAESRAGLR